ncbi:MULTISPECIES: hypothetical protein [unclassified Guyparkeria]|uniref:hypothetical protein n=1 Tax=unclassified Guyparkeria TaxID=2626246 RepID=UPI0007334E25|nr:MULTISPECIES: hypothetical protein [unclassified Guyparkeria]KTG17944.1 hypothetical protein AUR63_07460 [Guyparkeria sp. XI15]OAE89653.1 hypothetical protein AWR35_07475 [Guyparkeria sp. WRN-7]
MRRFPDRFPSIRPALLPLLLAGGLLAGCEAQVEAELDVGDIRERETTGLFATSKVTTGDCDRGIGASEREGTLGWTGWVLSGVFPDTRFRGCRETDGGATATYLNMFVFDASHGEALKGQSHVNLKLHDHIVSLGLPEYVQGHIERVRDQTGVESGPTISGHLTLLNSSDEPFVYRVMEYDESGKAGWSEPRELPGAARVDVELSPALSAFVLEGERAPLLKLE